MKINKRKYRLFGIPLARSKRVSEHRHWIYVIGIPLLVVSISDKQFNVYLWIWEQIECNIKRYHRRYKQWLIKKKNIKSKQEIIERFDKGGPVKIMLQASRPGMWCFDYLCNILKKDPRFSVCILVMPDHRYTKEMQKFYMEKTYDELSSNGCKLYKGYNFEKDEILDLRKEINPDIIFYTDFWKPHFYDQFYITRFFDKITLLNVYGISVMQDEKTCNFELNNLVDIYFRPSVIHKKMAEHLMNNNGKNVIVTGAPQLDYLFDSHYKVKDIWKKQDKHKKRIIWAPHYNHKTSANFYQNDGFWVLYDFMLEIAKKYQNTVQFVFRPHPVLRSVLAEEWGSEKTDAYYRQWDILSNGQYYDGNFIDLFMTSDAMIMDSCSFMAEYTAFDKPLFHTVTATSRTHLNDFGEELYKFFYKPIGDLKQGIIDFIENVVLKGNDPLGRARHEFVQKHFGKINGRTASENIYHEIINFLEGGKK